VEPATFRRTLTVTFEFHIVDMKAVRAEYGAL
jgi:hypothetical protein